jgi:hypothetical protein
MTDIDQLLTEDGARWRATQPAPPEPDATLLTRRRPGWQPLAAAAAALAVVAGAVTVAARQHPADPAPTPAASSPGPIVRDGDRVTGNVLISAMPGRGVRICGGDVTKEHLYPDGKTPLTPAYCTNGYTVTGVDLDRLSDRRVLAGTVIGTARVTGVYRAGTVMVTDQRTPTPPSLEPFLIRLPADCPAPAGGWPSTTDIPQAEVDRVGAYLDKHRAEFGNMTLATPDLRTRTPIVVLVTTPGDVAAATRAIRTIYGNLLCVRKVAHSLAQAYAARAAMTGPMNNSASVIRYRLAGGGAILADAGVGPYSDMHVLIWTEDVEKLHRTFGSVVKVMPGLEKVR